MISRRTRVRDYKEKKPMTAFGQVILPLAILMALALLYFSVRLFFFAPGSASKTQKPVADQSEMVATTPAEEAEPPIALEEDTFEEEAEVVVPEPAPQRQRNVSTTPRRAQQKPASARRTVQSQPQKQARKTATKPAAQKPAAQKAAPQPEPKAAKDNSPRWDIQIGGFSAKEGADVTVKQAKAAGYSVYVENTTLNSKPFYKVRVRGSANKSEAAEMSKKLQKAGFPVYLVEIKR